MGLLDGADMLSIRYLGGYKEKRGYWKEGS